MMEKPWLDEQLEDPEFCKGLIKELSTQYQDDLADLRRKLEEVTLFWEETRAANKFITEGLPGDQVKLYGTAGAKRIADLQAQVDEAVTQKRSLNQTIGKLNLRYAELQARVEALRGEHAGMYHWLMNVMQDGCIRERALELEPSSGVSLADCARTALAHPEPVEEKSDAS